MTWWSNISSYESKSNQMLTYFSPPIMDEIYARLQNFDKNLPIKHDTIVLASTYSHGQGLVRNLRWGHRREKNYYHHCQYANHTLHKCWDKNGKPKWVNQVSFWEESSQLTFSYYLLGASSYSFNIFTIVSSSSIPPSNSPFFPDHIAWVAQSDNSLVFSTQYTLWFIDSSVAKTCLLDKP